MKLLTAGQSNPKTAKIVGQPIVNAVLHLAPADQSGYEVCQFRTPGCTAACLNTAGRGGIPQPGRTDGHLNVIQAARVRRTKQFFESRQQFWHDLFGDLFRLQNRATREGALCAVRLNGTSDIPWHTVTPAIMRVTGDPTNVMGYFPDVQFYDYTKRPFDPKTLPKNYHLTFSASGENWVQCSDVLDAGGNVAMVFDKVPTGTFWGSPVIDGDKHDFRFLDPPGHIIGLKAKGKAKHDTTGFVVKST